MTSFNIDNIPLETPPSVREIEEVHKRKAVRNNIKTIIFIGVLTLFVTYVAHLIAKKMPYELSDYSFLDGLLMVACFAVVLFDLYMVLILSNLLASIHKDWKPISDIDYIELRELCDNNNKEVLAYIEKVRSSGRELANIELDKIRDYCQKEHVTKRSLGF